MNTVMAHISSQFQNFLHTINKLVQYWVSHQPGEDLSHLVQMRERLAATRPVEKKAVGDMLFKLRTRSRRLTTQECEARGHWFCQVVPVYQSPVNFNYLPTASYADELNLLKESKNGKTNENNSLPEMNKLYTMEMLLGKARKIMPV